MQPVSAIQWPSCKVRGPDSLPSLFAVCHPMAILQTDWSGQSSATIHHAEKIHRTPRAILQQPGQLTTPSQLQVRDTDADSRESDSHEGKNKDGEGEDVGIGRAKVTDRINNSVQTPINIFHIDAIRLDQYTSAIAPYDARHLELVLAATQWESETIRDIKERLMDMMEWGDDSMVSSVWNYCEKRPAFLEHRRRFLKNGFANFESGPSNPELAWIRVNTSQLQAY